MNDIKFLKNYFIFSYIQPCYSLDILQDLKDYKTCMENLQAHKGNGVWKRLVKGWGMQGWLTRSGHAARHGLQWSTLWSMMVEIGSLGSNKQGSIVGMHEGWCTVRGDDKSLGAWTWVFNDKKVGHVRPIPRSCGSPAFFFLIFLCKTEKICIS